MGRGLGPCNCYELLCGLYFPEPPHWLQQGYILTARCLRGVSLVSVFYTLGWDPPVNPRLIYEFLICFLDACWICEFFSRMPDAKELEMAVFLPNVQCSFKTVTILQQVYRHFLCRSIKFWRICNISPRCSIQSRKYNFPLKFDGFFRWRVISKVQMSFRKAQYSLGTS